MTQGPDADYDVRFNGSLSAFEAESEDVLYQRGIDFGVSAGVGYDLGPFANCYSLM